MSTWQPSVGQERWTALAVRLGIRQDLPWLRARTGPWKRVGVVLRSTLFVLGISLAALILEVGSMLHLPLHLLLTGLGLLAAAEWMIRRREMFCVGLDESLWLAGVLMIVAQVLESSGDFWNWNAALFSALTLGLAAARFRNPGVGLFAVIALSATVSLAARQTLGEQGATFGAAGVCMSVACLGLWMGQSLIRRPSLDQMLDWQVVCLPACAWIWLKAGAHSGPTLEELRQGRWLSCLPAVLLFAFGVSAVLLGLRRRVHAPLVAGMVCCGLLAIELNRLSPLSLEARLIVYGTVLLLSTIALERYLRTLRRGITSARLHVRVAPDDGIPGLAADDADAQDLLQHAGVAGLVAGTAASPPPADVTGAGGTFGGGGADGRF